MANVNVLGMFHIPLEYIHPNPSQPRQTFDQVKLQELADNIKANGLLQPIVIRKVTDTHFTIVAGERRYRAHKLLELTTIESKVVECDDETAYELSLLENLIRVDIDLLEEAKAYNHLRNKSYTLVQLGLIVSKSPSWVSNVLSLLEEDPQVQAYVVQGVLTSTVLQPLRQLPNLHEKLLLLEKVKAGEVNKSDVREYANQIRELYRISQELGIDPEEVRARGIHHKGPGGRFDVREELILPPDFQFFFICDHLISSAELQFFPRTTILSSAFTYMHSKSAAKRLTSILMRRRMIELLFFDSGAVTAAKKGQFEFFTKQDQLLQFYENHKPDICVMLDYPTYGGTFTPSQVVDGTLYNAFHFKDWHPSFDTVKVYVLQGAAPEDYLRCFRGLLDMGIFNISERQALAFGSIARDTLPQIEHKISLVLQDPDYQRIRPRLQFVHGFGVGQPHKIVRLYELGINSCDALTTVILTAVGKWWVRGKAVHHLIQESPLARRVRLIFNVVSFWGMLCELFAKQRGLELSQEKASVLTDLSFLENTEVEIEPAQFEEDTLSFDFEVPSEKKRRRSSSGKKSTKSKVAVDFGSFQEMFK